MPEIIILLIGIGLGGTAVWVVFSKAIEINYRLKRKRDKNGRYV